ncbi:MAG TPA: helix-turn-helix transcriptional regulator [Nitrosopumilaceae archaeon]|jgi:hypothetical protein|nr:helix-turn-helix transcriptional regulator [Nitrosopumilaceae archaeon]
MGWGTKLRGTGKKEATIKASIPKATKRILTSGKPQIKQTKTDFSEGERSPYREWESDHGNFDPISPDHITEDSQPWGSVDLSDSIEVLWDGFEEIYPKLKGRQKEVVDLLRQGHTNQTAIAIQLGIRPQSVTKILRALQNKIIKVTNKRKM